MLIGVGLDCKVEEMEIDRLTDKDAQFNSVYQPMSMFNVCYSVTDFNRNFHFELYNTRDSPILNLKGKVPVST